MICCQSAKSYDQKHGHGAAGFSNSLLCFTVCIIVSLQSRHFECRSFVETFTIDKKALT